MSSRLYILSDAFLIKVFLFYCVVFTRPSCYRFLLLGIDLTVARDCVPPSFNKQLPCDICILGGSSSCFLGFFLLDWSFEPGAARSLVFLYYIIEQGV